MRVRDLVCCVCGTPDLVAISPGADPERSGAAGIVVDDGAPVRAWCFDHWPTLRGKTGPIESAPQ